MMRRPSPAPAALRAAAAAALLLACRGAPKTEGHGAQSSDTAPPSELGAPDATWTRSEIAAPGSVTFTELQYHAAEAGLDWIELYNPMVLDMDLSGWSLAGGVDYAFERGTVLPAGGFLVVAADPARTAIDGAVGPWTGTLADDGERVDLRDKMGRRIDTIRYGDDDPWPVGPDGSGATLSKLDLDSASDHAENWTTSAMLGGTPGRDNALDPIHATTTATLVPLDTTWRYDDSGAYPAANWAAPSYDDRAWPSGAAVFYAGAPSAAVSAVITATADNFYAVYLGEADGTGLRWIGESDAGDWTSVEDFDAEVGPTDHLFLAAWEDPANDGGPQMLIAQADLPENTVGTRVDDFEWVLGPVGGAPGPLPPAAPPAESAVVGLIAGADAAGEWAAPAAEAAASSDPWGWAVAWAFDEANFVWADNFDSVSVTNTDQAYVLFRSVDPLQGPTGATELMSVPTTVTFRTSFDFASDPAATTLVATCQVDDGAVVYLNGVEVARTNMPAGAVTADTFATAVVDEVTPFYVELPTSALVVGENVLAVEMHQADEPEPDLTFACALTARVTTTPAAPPVLLHEIPAGETAPFWVEVVGAGAGAVSLDRLVLRSSAGDEVRLSPGDLAPDELSVVDDVGFAVSTGDALFLYDEGGATLLDAVRVNGGGRGRTGTSGPWRTPSEPSPGAANGIDESTDVVINEIQYHRAPASVEGEPFAERPEEWIELYNRGVEPVDLSGWRLVDAVAFGFPAGTVIAPGGYLVVSGNATELRAAHPSITVLGDFAGTLDNGGDRLLLLDARGNPADEVRYFDGGRWAAAADGGGSSLELQDPRADNSAGEAWAASDETAGSAWTSIDYRGIADPSAVGPDGVWNELVLGLLDAGEVLVDDVHVIQDPDTAPVDVVQNGNFSAGSDHWRLLGNHRHGEVVPDPDDPANPVLRLVATGPTGHMHNHVETTLTRPLRTTEYEISYRVRWVSGNNQLNSRLYFNRLPVTTRVPEGASSGTPGAKNSVWTPNVGPTFGALAQDVALPAAGSALSVRVDAADPDGVSGVTLWWRLDGEAWASAAMTEGELGKFGAAIPAQAAGALVQFYVEALDTLGATSTFPAAGPDSRALVRWDDGQAAENGLHNLRILVTGADSDWMHADENLMSDDAIGATVVYDDEVFYDVGLRTKGSERGRPEVARLGYGISFNPDHLFRGSHGSVLVDRSEGVGFGQREVLLNLMMTHAGAVFGEYNDLTFVVTPLAEHTGTAELQLDRFTSLVLDSQFDHGADGRLFEYELVYYPLTTVDGTAEGEKLPAPDSVVGTALTDLGDDKEAYRWDFLPQNNLAADDFAGLIQLDQTFAESGQAFLDDTDARLDVDEWLRSFAFATLAGAVDNYGGDGSQHNARFYVRPSDGRLLYFPHDLDFFGGPYGAVVGNGDLARLLEKPSNKRAYYGHLQDIIDTAYTTATLGPWCDQLAERLRDQDFAGHCQFMDDRAAWVQSGAPNSIDAVFPALDFQITTGGGADFSTSAAEATLEGQGWVDVRNIVLQSGESLEVTWPAADTWRVTVPLQSGANPFMLVATNFQGDVVGEDTITVTSTAP